MGVFDLLHFCAFLWFLLMWSGYTFYGKRHSKKRDCISKVLHSYRIDWMKNVVRRENRIADFALVENLSKTVNFFASTTIFLLAGIITIFYYSAGVADLFTNYSFIADTSVEQIQFKLGLLIVVFVFAFFRFTWSMRQYSFVAIALGSAKYVKSDVDTLDKNQEQFVQYIAKISDLAGHEFNYGLRAYYFSLTILCWFISSWYFIFACTAIVMVLYRREYHSKTLKYLLLSRKGFEGMLCNDDDSKNTE